MSVYYNEFEPYAAEWLRNLIKAGHIPDGEVDTRSIVDVEPADLRGFAQCHFFSGIGGWSHALRLAGWADDREIWTGSCPCQPFSVAGKGAGTDDPRHLWPHFFRLIRSCRPAVVMGEQVAGKAGYGWFDGVRADLEGEGYASRAVDIPACAVNAPHIRQRLYWCAVENAGDDRTRRYAGATADEGRRTFDAGAASLRQGDWPCGASGPAARNTGDMADAVCPERWPQPEGRHNDDNGADAGRQETASGHPLHSFWHDAEWATGADGKTRRVKSGVRLLAHGIPARVGRLRAYGNAIVPPLAAEVIKAFMETHDHG